MYIWLACQSEFVSKNPHETFSLRRLLQLSQPKVTARFDFILFCIILNYLINTLFLCLFTKKIQPCALFLGTACLLFSTRNPALCNLCGYRISRTNLVLCGLFCTLHILFFQNFSPLFNYSILCAIIRLSSLFWSPITHNNYVSNFQGSK